MIVEIAVLVAGVDAKQVVRGGKAMDQKIVYEGAGSREQAGVLRLAVGKLRGVVRGDVLDQFERVRSADFDFAHVADVEKARGGAGGHVLGDDAGIFNRHVPAAEIHHPGAHAAMDRMERSLTQLDGRRNRQRFALDLRKPVNVARSAEKCQESPYMPW